MPRSVGRCWLRGSLILPPGEIFIAQPLGGALLASGGWRPGVLLSTPQHPGQPAAENDPARSPGLVPVQVWSPGAPAPAEPAGL